MDLIMTFSNMYTNVTCLYLLPITFLNLSSLWFFAFVRIAPLFSSLNTGVCW